jgi:hypothetical protein
MTSPGSGPVIGSGSVLVVMARPKARGDVAAAVSQFRVFRRPRSAIPVLRL